MAKRLINVRVTDDEYLRLATYAESNFQSRTAVLRALIRSLKVKQPKPAAGNIEPTPPPPGQDANSSPIGCRPRRSNCR
jgi:hypothetical protein